MTVDRAAVSHALSPRARLRTSPENVADVLDALAHVTRALPPSAWICTRRLDGDKAVFDLPCTTANHAYAQAHPRHDWEPLYRVPGVAAAPRMRWSLDEQASALLHTMTGSDDAEDATPVTLFVGESRDDDGKLVYGLHAYESEYPCEGVTPLVEFDPPSAAQAADGAEAVDEVVACLGDDAAQLREENPEDERAANMDRAATMLGNMASAIDELLTLCALGDVDESTEVHGWGEAIKRARAARGGING